MRTAIRKVPDSDKAQCARNQMAELYVQSFFPGIINPDERSAKVKEIETILVNSENEQAEHRTLTVGVYGNEGFFNQVATPLRQLITSALEQNMPNLGDLRDLRDLGDLGDDAAVQAFLKKL
jgi:hypothetical protein